jgi:dienelactone hydrolase
MLGNSHGHEDFISQVRWKTGQGYLARQRNANALGVVVIQEWWGLRDQIRICDRLALAGYEARAPDLYARTVVHITTGAGPR